MPNKVFGLIGNPIKHSFSKTYFDKKSLQEGITDCEYRLFPLESIKDLPQLLKSVPNLQGLNVTSPYKVQIMDYLDAVSQDAYSIGAVNTVKIQNQKLTGYNTDHTGFIKSLKEQTDITSLQTALILGTGGAAKAVSFALKKHNIHCIYATTKTIFNSEETISYPVLSRFENLDMFDLIVNATPCGMESVAPLNNFPYNYITPKHLVFDLIYNPTETFLLSVAKKQGAKTVNGLKMLYYQADESHRIWNAVN